ncbi:hypothetical protein D3C72_257680 [compost metagenome]
MWLVSGTGAGQIFPTKAAAVKAAQTTVREAGGLVTIKNAKGGVGKSFTLGRSAMTKLNAVEGVILGQATQKAFSELDRIDALPAQRRAFLRNEFAKLSVGMVTLHSTQTTKRRG